MKKTMTMLVLMIVAAVVLSGCMYPEKAQNQVPYKAQLQSVQSAVTQFKEAEGGILPIVTKDADTAIYQKYPIDFKKIAPRFMAEAPANAYESGGVFQYVLVDVEKNPTVKLLDVRIPQKIQDVMLRLMVYKEKNTYPPYKEHLSGNVYTIDYEKLGIKEVPTVTSPYSQKQLQIVINSEAELFVDYTPDLQEALSGHEGEIKQGEDIRYLLLEGSDFVPVNSLPYTIDEKMNIPIFLTN